jgi:DNA-binding NtrC family response regulator
MKKKYLILIADRNPHIRDYLTRELTGECYHVFSVKNVGQLHSWIFNHHPLDILVLDPNLLGDESSDDLEALLRRIPSVTVIFHCLPADCPAYSCQPAQSAFIEKSGTSVILLKQFIHSLIANEDKTNLSR